MSYIYMEHLFLMFLDHTQRHTTVGRIPLEEWSARRRDLYLTTHDTHNRQISMPPVGFEPKISAGERPQAARLLSHISESLNKSSNAVWRRLMKIPVLWYVTVSLGEKLLVFRMQHNPSKHGNYLLSDTVSHSGRLVPSTTTPPQEPQISQGFWMQNHWPGQKFGSSYSLVNVRCGPRSLA